jgi:hypothetical protein
MAAQYSHRCLIFTIELEESEANRCRQWWVGDPTQLLDATNIADQNVSFQMVSLLKLAKVTEEGVKFLSPHDGTPMYKP